MAKKEKRKVQREYAAKEERGTSEGTRERSESPLAFLEIKM